EIGTDALLHMQYDVPFLEGLSARASYSKNYVSNFDKTFFKKHRLFKYERIGSTGKFYTENLVGPTYYQVPAREYLSNQFNKTSSYQFNAQLSFVRELGKHNVDEMAIDEEFDGGNQNIMLTRHDVPLITRDQFFATSNNEENSTGNGSESYNGRKSYLARVNYEFDDKYIFSGAFRADGSMLFAPEKRWGYFPSASVAWIISRGAFFAENIPQIPLLKIRTSYG